MANHVEPEKAPQGTKDQDWVTKLWDFFTSMKLGLILLLILAIASIAGTIIPQNRPDQFYNQNLIGLYKILGLTDAYHAWWYKLLLFLLTTNLFICTINRFQPLLNAYRNPLTRVSSNFLKKLKSYHGEGLKQDPEAASDKLQSLLKRKGFGVTRESEGGKVYLYGEKGKLGPWGSFITHISFLIIAAGALIGTFAGYEGRADVPVGQSFQISQVEGFPSFSSEKDMTVTVHRFDTLFNPDGTISDWITNLSIVDGAGNTYGPADVRVNHPADYKGVKIYQTSYGALVRYKVATGVDQPPQEYELYSGGFEPNQELIRFPNTDYALGVWVRYDAGVTGIPHNPVFSDPQNPDVQYAIFKGREVVAEGSPKFGEPILIPEVGAVMFTDYMPVTSLTLRHDPGVGVVWLGSGLMILGMLISFYMPHRRVWAILSDDQGHTALEIGGQAQKNKLGFAREFEQLIEEWKLSTKH